MRPLTNTVPKPLLPLAGKAMVDHIVDRLPPEVDEVIMAANYLIDQLREHFDARRDEGRGPTVRVVDEPEPRGTGGAVKNAQEYLDDTFFVFNGDIITSLDLTEFLRYHREKGGIGTLSLWKVDDPSRFGAVRFGDDGRITSFVEKPEPPPGEGAKPEWINAGVYIFEPEFLDHIEPGRKVSSEREVFPKILDRGLFAMTFGGYWVDAGKPPDYLAAQRALMDERAGADGGGLWLEGDLDGDERGALRAPVMAGAGCSIGPSALVGPHVTLGANVIVGPSATVLDSALFDGVWVGEGAVVSGAILGEGAKVGKGAVVEDGAVLDRGEEVGEGEVRRGSP